MPVFLNFLENFIDFFKFSNTVWYTFNIKISSTENQQTVYVLLILIKHFHYKHHKFFHKPVKHYCLGWSDIIKCSKFFQNFASFLKCNNFWINKQMFKEKIYGLVHYSIGWFRKVSPKLCNLLTSSNEKTSQTFSLTQYDASSFKRAFKR